jgi:photosystem II stability/assembly factor-like uncharacterized protein
MKQLFTIAVFLTLAFASSGVYAQGFNSVHSPNGTFVIAAGDQGLVFRSSNSGTSWETFNIGSNSLKSVTSFGNAYWIVSDNGRMYKGDITVPGSVIARTVENGVSLNGITFVNANTGYICGNGGKIYKSVDGGNSWSLSNSGIGPFNLNALSFLDASNGVVVGNTGAIFITSNGGASWSNSTSITNKNLLKVKYFTGGIAAVGEYGTLLTKTGAAAFTTIPARVITDIKGVSGTGMTDIHVCGGGGFIRNNKSGNTNFLNFEINPMAANLADIYFYDANTAYAVSSLNKSIIRTTNGGAQWDFTGGTTLSYTWQTKLTNSGGIGNGFYYPPDQYLTPQNRDVVFICQGNKVYRSPDRGETWVQIATVSSGSTAHSFYVSPIDTNLMLASMDSFNGRVMRSTNYGQTWTQVWNGALTSYGMPLEMDWNNPNVVYLGPDNAAMLKSTNFGLNWTTLSSNNFVSPCDIAIQNGNSNIMYLGDSGPSKLWKSTDGGVTWTLRNSPNTSEIPMIGMSQLDTNLSYHTAWSASGVFKTNDKWDNNIVNVTTTSSAWGCDISKDDPTAFSFITYGRVGYLTLNAGASFTNVTSIASANAGVLYLNKGEVLGQGTSGVYKLAITYNVSATPVTVTGVQPGEITGIPEKYNLYQNYPNPFNPVTKIKYDLPESSVIKITVYDQLGKQVAVLANGFTNAGSYEVSFDASGLASGIYVCKLETPDASFTRKMSLIK